MLSGKKTLIIPSGKEEERPKMAMVFRRVKAKEIAVEKEKEPTNEEEMIDHIHEQLMQLSRITRKKQIKITDCAMRMEEAEKKAVKGDEAYQNLMIELTKAEEAYRHAQEENLHLQQALVQKDEELLKVVQQQSMVTAEAGKLKLALQVSIQ